MNLDEARELKLNFSQTIIAGLAQTARKRASFGIASRRVLSEEEKNVPRTLAVGIALRGKEFRVAIRVQHRAMENSPEIELMRRRAKGEVDVRYVGRVLKLAKPWHQSRCRPLLIGSSVGHFNVTAGTLGCLCRARKDGDLHILSNNHVLADENRATIGDAILQPGTIDGGKNPQDKVATVAKFQKLNRLGTNHLDCAIALVDRGIKVDINKLKGLGVLAGVRAALLDAGTEVAKLGRTTGLTRGRVTAFELDNVVAQYDMGNLRFDNQVEIEGADDAAFSESGDSGSLIVDEDCLAAALLFAGGDQGGTNGKGLTYAQPIQTVLDAMDVDLAF